MPYSRTTFHDDAPPAITAAELANINDGIEQGITAAAGALAAANGAGTAAAAAQASADAAVLIATSAQTANYTLVLSDKGKAVEVTSASAVNVTVPPNSSVAFPVGTVIEVDQIGAGAVTLVAGSGVTLRTPSSLVTRAQYSALTLRKQATDTWLVGGDMQ